MDEKDTTKEDISEVSNVASEIIENNVKKAEMDKEGTEKVSISNSSEGASESSGNNKQENDSAKGEEANEESALE